MRTITAAGLLDEAMQSPGARLHVEHSRRGTFFWVSIVKTPRLIGGAYRVRRSALDRWLTCGGWLVPMQDKLPIPDVEGAEPVNSISLLHCQTYVNSDAPTSQEKERATSF